MLVTLEEILRGAAEKEYAVAGFNVFGYEDALPVIQAAEDLDAPVILMANIPAVVHMSVAYLGPLLKQMAIKAKVPVCVHLDHAKDFTVIAQAIQNGFSSVMYDGSQLPFDENVQNTREVVKLARACGVSVEAEIGSVGYSDPSVQARHIYTDPGEAERFTVRTGIDAVAVAIGTVHRMQVQEARLQYDRLAAIQERVDIPLVIHGSTGVADEDLKKLAGYRVGKINIGTALRMAFGHALREEMAARPDEFDRITLFQRPMEMVRKAARQKMEILGFQKR